MEKVDTTEAYNKFAKYYDIYVNDFKEDIELYCSFCRKGDRVLEVGCGTGRVLKFLLDKGLTNVTGIDVSDGMLDICRNKLDKYIENNNLTLKKHDFCSRSLKGDFDKVFVTFYTFNYIVVNPVKFLRNIASSMCNNGLIVIDLFYPKLFLEPESDGIWVERKIKLGGNRIILLRDKREFDGSIERRTQVFIEDNVETVVETARRFYSREEMGKLLLDAGFRNIKVIYGYSLGDDTGAETEHYPLCGYDEFNVNAEEYTNREEVKRNYVIYADRAT